MIIVFLPFHRAAARQKRLHACIAGALLHTTLGALAFLLQIGIILCSAVSPSHVGRVRTGAPARLNSLIGRLVLAVLCSLC